MADSLVNKGIDSLSNTSRELYERTFAKTVLSIIYAGFSLMFLGFCSEAAGKSASSANTVQSLGSDNDDHLKLSLDALVGGYGFASFCYLVSFTLSLAAAIIISPLFLGSPQEYKILTKPNTFETSV